jgi:hypothetical protein
LKFERQSITDNSGDEKLNGPVKINGTINGHMNGHIAAKCVDDDESDITTMTKAFITYISHSNKVLVGP